MNTGVVLQGVDSPSEFEAIVTEIEALGYDSLWCTDSTLHARDPYSYLTLAARVSKHLSLGTAVTNTHTRHPALTAVSIATLDEISGGRAVLGIGAGDRPTVALGYSPATRLRLRSSIRWIRELLAGSTVDDSVDGTVLDNAKIRVETRPDIPIFISASGPKMLELAGEIGDGVIVLPGLFKGCIEDALDRIERGAQEAGRPRPHVALFVYGAISDDEEACVDAARTIAAWFPQTTPHYCRIAGLDEGTIEAVRNRYRGGEFQEAKEAGLVLPEEFVQRMALAGNRERATAQIRGALDAGVDSVHVFPLGEDRLGTIREFARCAEAVDQ